MADRRVLIAAGGTGGHFYPGLVLAQTLAGRGWQPLMLVKEGDPALATLEREGIAACEAPLRGMPRSVGLPLARFGRDLIKTLGLVGRVVADFRPDAVVGMGGYLTFPAIAAAARRRVPRALHESNAVLGLANRAAASLGATLFWGLPPADGGAGRVVGTPIRKALWERGDTAQARRALGLTESGTTVLVFGGSQGARGINRGAPAALASAAKAAPGLQVLHLAGRGNDAEVAALYRDAGVSAKVLPFLDGMERAYAAADFVICRSGASTSAELSAQRAPSVLVPFPSAAGNHQEINARVVERAGACRVVLERDLPHRLPAVLGELLSSAGPRTAMAGAYGKLGLPQPGDCAKALADAVEALAR